MHLVPARAPAGRTRQCEPVPLRHNLDIMTGPSGVPWELQCCSFCAAPTADTFWNAVVRGAAPHETLPFEHPPLAYYSSPCEGLERQRPPRRLKQQEQQEQQEKQTEGWVGEAAQAQPVLASA